MMSLHKTPTCELDMLLEAIDLCDLLQQERGSAIIRRCPELCPPLCPNNPVWITQRSGGNKGREKTDYVTPENS